MVFFRDLNASSLDIWVVYETPDPDFQKHMRVRAADESRDHARGGRPRPGVRLSDADAASRAAGAGPIGEAPRLEVSGGMFLFDGVRAAARYRRVFEAKTNPIPLCVVLALP